MRWALASDAWWGRDPAPGWCGTLGIPFDLLEKVDCGPTDTYSLKISQKRPTQPPTKNPTSERRSCPTWPKKAQKKIWKSSSEWILDKNLDIYRGVYPPPPERFWRSKYSPGRGTRPELGIEAAEAEAGALGGLGTEEVAHDTGGTDAAGAPCPKRWFKMWRVCEDCCYLNLTLFTLFQQNLS